MLNNFEHDKLLHNLKRAAKVIKFIHDEEDHDKRQTFISLLADELDDMAKDLENFKEKLPEQKESK